MQNSHWWNEPVERRKKEADSLVPFDELVFTERVLGGDNHLFRSSEKLILIRKTLEDPYGQLATNGRQHNWVVQASNGITIWASIERMLEEGRLSLVQSTDDERAARSVLCL